MLHLPPLNLLGDVTDLTEIAAPDAEAAGASSTWAEDARRFGEAENVPYRETRETPPRTLLPRDPMNAKADVDPTSTGVLDTAMAAMAPRGLAWRLPVPLRVLHGFIIANLAIQVLYGTFQVFWVLQPPGVIGPMFGAAMEVPFELMMARRMYALESWIAFLGLSLYIGVTEVLPRRWP